MHRNLSARLSSRLGATLLLTTALCLTGGAAHAVDNVRADINSGCSVWPSSSYQDFRDSNQEPTGLSFDSDRLSGSAVPQDHRLTAYSHAISPGGTGGDDCDVDASYQDQLFVAPGTSGLADGAPVTATLNLTLDHTITGAAPASGNYISHSLSDGRVSLTSVDDCVFANESMVCETPFDFDFDHEHQFDRYNGSLDVQAKRLYDLQVDGQSVASEEQYDESGTASLAAEPQVLHLTHAITLKVGHHYNLKGAAEAFTQGYYAGTGAEARIADFSVSVEGVSNGAAVQWASAGDQPPADTTPPGLTVPSSVTAASPDGQPVPVTFTATSDDPTATVSCTPASGSAFPVGTTTVQCTATDPAGNSTPGSFAVTVTAPPADPFATLGSLIAGVGDKGIRNALQVKLDAARAALAAPDLRAGCASLTALANQVRAQSGKKLTATDAGAMLTQVAALAASYGC